MRQMAKMLLAAGCVLFAATLGACNAPKVEREAEIARFRAALTERTAGLEIPAEGPLTLEACQAIALANNLAFRVDQLALQLQDQQVRLALAGGLPRVTGAYRGTTRSNEPLVSFGGGPGVPMEDRKQQMVAVEATVPVLDFGLTYYAWQIAKDRREQERLLVLRAAQVLQRDVAIAYVEHAGALRQLAIAKLNVEAAEAILKVAQSMEREELATSAETAVFRSALAQVEVQRTEAQRRVAETRLTLGQLLGVPPGAVPAVIVALPELPVPPDEETLARLELHALQVRPELHVQDLERHIAANAVRRAIADFFPRLDLVGSFNWTSNSFMVNPAYFVGGAQVAGTLVEGGAKIARYRLAKGQLPVEQERALLLALGVLYDVDLRAVQLRHQRETIAALEVSESARQEALARIISLYKEGLENEAATARALADLNVETLALDQARTDYLVRWHQFLAAALPGVEAPGAPETPAATAPATMPAETRATTEEAGRP